ncbi:MAG: SDR family NAD(P)-dependent oxidoreductase [Isosphaeraceae bacterium]
MPLLRNALVTGASSGLGHELVRQLVRDRNMNVLATARREDRLLALAAEFPAGRIEVLPGDLTSPTFRQRLWERAESLPGGLDLLVNNAGVGNYAEFVDQDPEAIRQIFELNVIALIDLSQMAARSMKARGAGQILQISSVLGFIGIPASAVYAASKHAVNGLVKSLRYELRGTGVRVWAACPGRTQSEFRSVALGEQAAKIALLPSGEPTARIVRAIVRGVDGRSAFLLPSWKAWAVVTLAHWLPGPFDWMMSHWAPGSYQNVIKPLSDRSGSATESSQLET